MSRSARFTGVFGDGRHDFMLNIAELEELQEKCDAGPEEIRDRVVMGRWRIEDIRETLRLGLKGAGMDATMALVMMERYAAPGNLAPHKPLVACIISAALMGSPEEDVAPSGEAKGETRRSPARKSGSSGSTKSAGRSGSRRSKSDGPPSGN